MIFFTKKRVMLFFSAGFFSLYIGLTKICMADQGSEDVIYKGCKIVRNAYVSRNLYVGGNEQVAGSVTATNFFTPSGPISSDVTNYAVLSNQGAINTGDTVLWAATPASSISLGITLNTTTGLVTLPTAGIFLVQYTVRFVIQLFNGTTTVVAQLQQTVAGMPTDITQDSITTNSSFDTVDATTPQLQRTITGYALINVTSALNNNINLIVSLSNDNAFIPATSGTDANAQMVIVRLS